MTPDSHPSETEPIPDLPPIPASPAVGTLTWVMIAVLVVLALVGGWWWGSRRPVPDAVITPVTANAPPTTQGWVTVHVAGWVAQPGIVTLSAGSRVVDAITAAGGVSPGGSLDGINLAEAVVDGARVEVPGPGEAAPPSSTPGTGSDGPINLNTADRTALEGLPGVGPVLAGKIIEHRESNGQFETVEDLLDVPGIGEATLEELRPHVTTP